MCKSLNILTRLFDIKGVFQREWTKKSASLNTTVYLKTIVHFDGYMIVCCRSEWMFGTYQR
jgi:hypothetical protein